MSVIREQFNIALIIIFVQLWINSAQAADSYYQSIEPPNAPVNVTSLPPAAPPGRYLNSSPPSSITASDEQRIAALEQIAFGSSYPEHENADRITHLEKEVFGGPSSGSTSYRLSRLEQRLAGTSAFGNKNYD